MDSMRNSINRATQVADIYIFRTNITNRSEFISVSRDLRRSPGIQFCTIDLEDCDRVLRVGCENVPIRTVVDEVVRHGFLCEELSD